MRIILILSILLFSCGAGSDKQIGTLQIKLGECVRSIDDVRESGKVVNAHCVDDACFYSVKIKYGATRLYNEKYIEKVDCSLVSFGLSDER